MGLLWLDRGSILEAMGSIAGALGSLLEAWGQKGAAPPRSVTPQRAKTIKNHWFFEVFRGSRVRGLWKIGIPRSGCEGPRTSYFGRIGGRFWRFGGRSGKLGGRFWKLWRAIWEASVDLGILGIILGRWKDQTAQLDQEVSPLEQQKP